ncbi:MAG TPA: hypothetical protein VMJ65_03480 [Solirubrobacteraceae bacterium]|nr:hypothetical protein [Solirubrobacteraceae bacterium]
MMRRLVTSLLMVCALMGAAPAVVAAQSGGGTASEAITDCNNHGKLTGHYSSDTLRNALAVMPADVREYTDCYDVIQKQLFAQLGSTASGSTGGGSSSGGSVLPTWLIIVIVVLALAALTFGALAIRRRQLDAGSGPETPGETESGASPPVPPEDRPDDPGGSSPTPGA